MRICRVQARVSYFTTLAVIVLRIPVSPAGNQGWRLSSNCAAKMSAKGSKWNAVVLGSVAAASLGIVIVGSLAQADEEPIESQTNPDVKRGGRSQLLIAER